MSRCLDGLTESAERPLAEPVRFGGLKAMPFYVRAGVGPIRYSHRIGGSRRRKNSGSGLGGAFFVLLIVLGFCFQLNQVFAYVMTAVFGMMGLLAVIGSTMPDKLRR
jgi:hypothetical protein